VNELKVLPPVPCGTVLSGMKPEPMLASNLTFTVKFVAVPAGATLIAPPIPVPGPGLSPVKVFELAQVSPLGGAVIVIVILTGTLTAGGPV